MKYGYFDRDNDEYVIDRVDLPTSWTNYLGVEDMCAVVNHTAGGYLFYRSPEYHRFKFKDITGLFLYYTLYFTA